MLELIMGFISIVCITYGVFLIIGSMSDQKIKNETINTLNKHGEISIKDKRILFEKNDNTYEILFYKIRKNHELTINSKMIWEIHTHTRSHLINQVKFLSNKTPKIIILFPINTNIKRYINENEMEFIDYQDVFFNMRLVKLSELELFLTNVEL